MTVESLLLAARLAVGVGQADIEIAAASAASAASASCRVLACTLSLLAVAKLLIARILLDAREESVRIRGIETRAGGQVTERGTLEVNANCSKAGIALLHETGHHLALAIYLCEP